MTVVIILALDTTTRAGSVAVVRARGADDRVLALLPGDESRTHGERLPAEIAVALDRAGVSREQIDLLAVAAGPGGFTGLRIGLAAMQGLAMTLNKPVAGVSALAALAAQVTNGDLIAPWMDAQRGDVFATLIDARTATEIEAPVAESPSRILERWRSQWAAHRIVFVGDAVTRDAAAIAAAGAGQWRVQLPEPLAPQIAMLGKRLAEQGRAGPPHTLTPVYVRRPDAEIEREQRRPTG